MKFIFILAIIISISVCSLKKYDKRQNVPGGSNNPVLIQKGNLYPKRDNLATNIILRRPAPLGPSFLDTQFGPEKPKEDGERKTLKDFKGAYRENNKIYLPHKSEENNQPKTFKQNTKFQSQRKKSLKQLRRH